MTMDPSRIPPHTKQSLPSITTLTANLPENSTVSPQQHQAEMSPLPFRTSSHISDLRDSGNWSASKHSSGVSNNGFGLHSILNSEDSPSRNSVASTQLDQSRNSVASSHLLDQSRNSVASSHLDQSRNSIASTHLDQSRNSVASTHLDQPLSARSLHPLPSLTQGYDPRASADVASLVDSSRRSSIDSRMNVGMNHLHLGTSAATAPSIYEKSQNVSRSSLVSNLQQQRGISQPDQRPGIASPMSPLGQRNGFRPSVAPRRAPVINNPRAISELATAENPTKGFAWAFPDAEAPSERNSSSEGSERNMSRHNSIAASMNSSIFTNDSSFPTGQKRFSEDIQTHHHSMQHTVTNGLRPGDVGPASPGAGTYSRTPELRVSHKMAERKRRSEMKNLFDELSNILPSSAGGKSSKWEVLTRAIDHITKTKAELQRFNTYRTEFDALRREHEALREECAKIWHELQRLEPNRPHVYGQFSSTLAREQTQTQGAMGHALPAIPAQWNAPPSSSLMQGVEYGNGNREYIRP